MEPRRQCNVARLDLEILEGRAVPSLLTLSPLPSQIIGSDSYLHQLPRTGGAAVQVGSLLELGVAPPLIPGFGVSSTLILQDGRGNVAVEWDGQPFQFFSGIDTITLNADAPGNLAFLVSLGPLSSPQQVGVQMSGILNIFVGLVPPSGSSLQVQATPGVFSLVI